MGAPRRYHGLGHYGLGLLKYAFLQDLLSILDAVLGMIADADLASNYGICLSELIHFAGTVRARRRCIEIDLAYTHAYAGLGVA